MNKNLLKLIAIALSTAVTLVVVITSSYAWLNLSSTPSATGMEISIGAKNTILIAPDVSQTVDGAVIHYPGVFQETLNFSKERQYDYLQDVVALAPVSTADGIHWYFPNRTETGTAATDDYLLDNTLHYANAQTLPDDDTVQGGYAYLDFWVVSPTYCELRVSGGQGNSGSYVVSLPQPVETENGEYGLDFSRQGTAACVRVGFLANDQKVTDASMNAYVRTAAFNEQYRALRGIYQEKGGAWNSYPTAFTIYEPNADRHHADGVHILADNGVDYVLCHDGSYVKTKPIGNQNGFPQPTDVMDRTVVQTASEWIKASENEYQVEQMFKAYLLGSSAQNVADMTSGFYRTYLGYRCDNLLKKGTFFRNSANLAHALDINGVADAETLNGVSVDTVTEDVMIVQLEKNIPQRIRMFVWVEGADPDCNKVKAGGGLLVNLELAGGNED